MCTFYVSLLRASLYFFYFRFLNEKKKKNCVKNSYYVFIIHTSQNSSKLMSDHDHYCSESFKCVPCLEVKCKKKTLWNKNKGWTVSSLRQHFSLFRYSQYFLCTTVIYSEFSLNNNSTHFRYWFRFKILENVSKSIHYSFAIVILSIVYTIDRRMRTVQSR